MVTIFCVWIVSKFLVGESALVSSEWVIIRRLLCVCDHSIFGPLLTLFFSFDIDHSFLQVWVLCVVFLPMPKFSCYQLAFGPSKIQDIWSGLSGAIMHAVLVLCACNHNDGLQVRYALCIQKVFSSKLIMAYKYRLLMHDLFLVACIQIFVRRFSTLPRAVYLQCKESLV